MQGVCTRWGPPGERKALSGAVSDAVRRRLSGRRWPLSYMLGDVWDSDGGEEGYRWACRERDGVRGLCRRL